MTAGRCACATCTVESTAISAAANPEAQVSRIPTAMISTLAAIRCSRQSQLSKCAAPGCDCPMVRQFTGLPACPGTEATAEIGDGRYGRLRLQADAALMVRTHR